MTSTALAGIFRSLRIYRQDPAREAAMDRLYGRYLRTGDLAFDIGAHVGDRTACFRRLDARVVAVEPQPLCQRALRLLHGDDPKVHLVQAAVGERTGRTALFLNRSNPTVSTASPQFIEAAAGASGWEGQTWDVSIDVAVVTLDQLIAAHGIPSFVKIDVEGSEPAVLRGLNHRIPALSFEFTIIQRQAAFECLRRLAELGSYQFNAALGESQRLEFDVPMGAAALSAWLTRLPEASNSGDVYASLVER